MKIFKYSSGIKKENVASEVKAFERIPKCCCFPKPYRDFLNGMLDLKRHEKSSVLLFIHPSKSQSVQQLLLLSGEVIFFSFKTRH